ncbi:MAG: hypothetical protein US69_C0008G0017 [candidate division TM6 bacterium GW2011_GWF2_38_10]|nr:MAG: hypothetical protein US69_C0008G0017 [candidate division TM6 bacterium GW2011_GWF2_38_10]
MMMKKELGLGVHDFKTLIERGYYYVDKSMFIYDVLHEAKPVTILPRPRRFGKTLNMSMLQYFFEKNPKQSDNRHLFDGLAITNYPEVMAQQGQYPVIFISFKGIKSSTWQGCYEAITLLITAECKRHGVVLQNSCIDEHNQSIWQALITQKASQTHYEQALKFLSEHLYNVYNQKVIILIDEYDAPMQAGFEFNYYEEIKNFMYNFFCAGLKDNNYLEFSVITGILRIAKDSLFSGMNNAATYSLLDDAFADKFGFLEDEVTAVLNYFQTQIDREKVREWYNGYRVGLPKYDVQGHESFTMVYNPWSIIECINKKALGAHWINTGVHMLIEKSMRKASAEDKENLLRILDGGSIEKTISDTIVFRDVYNDSSALWSFLVFTGYLTWKSRTNMVGKTTAALIAPNFEVLDSLKTMVTSWFNEVPASRVYFDHMINGIKTGDVEEFLQNFEQAVLESLSFFDVGDKGENAYQAFALGIFASLGHTYETASNRESGYGRYDVCIFPKDTKKMGMIIEFKRRKLSEKKPLSTYAKGAREQIDEYAYDLEMQRRGILVVAKIGIAFQGKHMAWMYQVYNSGMLISKGAYSAEPKKQSKKRGTKK